MPTPLIDPAGMRALADGPTRLLHQEAPLPNGADGEPLTRAMLICWLSRPDLQAAFDVSSAAGRRGFREWSRSELNGSAARGWVRRLLSRGAGSREPSPGVNLVGYSQGVLGMGEHVRMSAAAMRAAEVPAGVVDFTLGLGKRRQPVRLGLPKLRGPKHRCNLFHINADQMVRTYWHLGPSFFAGRYNVGYWAWELARWPESWLPAIALVDEIWAPSRFVRDALSAATGKPVEWMPLCVELPPLRRLPRSSFAAGEDEFLFVFTFDCHSYFDRKNPLAAIRAFRAAFPGRERARLIIKGMNGHVCRAEWARLCAEAEKDGRIRVIDETWPRERLLALVDSSDAYISLHRSEGFGRGPAEAMLMGKPVIVTDYSGTADFCRSDNALLVDYDLVEVETGSYVHAAGQVWADPSIDSAASHMRALFDDRSLGPRIGARGRQTISEEFSAMAIGRRYRARLLELGVI